MALGGNAEANLCREKGAERLHAVSRDDPLNVQRTSWIEQANARDRRTMTRQDAVAPRNYSFRAALLRALILLIGMVALLIGGTFTGITDPRLQRISLTVLSVTVLVWLLVFWRSPRRSQPGAPFGVLIVSWGGVFALSLAASPSGRSLIALWYMALYAGLWLLLSDVRQRGVPGTAFSDLLIVAALPLIYWAMVQVLPWFPRWWAVRDLGVPFYPARPVGTFGNPNLLGAFLALALPFACARGLSLPDRLGRGLMSVWGALAAATLYLTYSRGAWLGAASGLAVFGALAIGSAHGSWRDRALARWRRSGAVRGAAVLGLALVLVALMAGGVFAWRAFDSPQRETGARLRYFALARDLAIARPLTGSGLFTFGRELAAVESIPPEQPHAHAHNLVLNVGAELGVPGLLALALTAGLIARELRQGLREGDRARQLQAAASAGSMAAIGVHSLVDMPLMAPSLVFAALFALAAGISPARSEPPTWHNGTWFRVVMSLTWLAILSLGWKHTQDNERYTRGLTAVAAGRYSPALADLRAATEAQPWNTQYLTEYAYAAGLAAGQGDREAATEAATAYQHALSDEPEQALWWANLAAVEWQRGDETAALNAMRRAVQAAPDAAEFWLNLGHYAEQVGDPLTAQRAYGRALALAPRMARASYWRETPLRRVALARTSDAAFPEEMARRLWLSGDDQAAIALLHRTITRDPTQPRPFIEVARLAAQSGQMDRAAAYLDAADVLNPLGQDAAWAALLRAEIAALHGDGAQAAAWRERARLAVAPDRTGYGLMYGQDTAQYQFLSLTVQGKLLPQLVVLGPEPAALDAATD